MISFEAYYQFREILIQYSPVLRLLIFLSGLFLIISAFLKPRLRVASIIISLTVFTSLFILIFILHNTLYNSVFVQISNEMTVRLFPPLWIESEKLFFWSFLALIFSLFFFLSKSGREFSNYFLPAVGILVCLTAVFDPFSNPLPLLHSEIISFEKALNSPQSMASMQFIISFYYRVKYFYHSTYMWTHPPMLFISYALFLIAFPLHLRLLIKSSFDARLESLSYKVTALGYTVLTVGMLAGYPWAVEAWKGQSWWWSAKINTSITMWILYTAYLHGRIYIGRRSLSFLSILTAVLSFVALVFTYLTTYLIPGVHSYG